MLKKFDDFEINWIDDFRLISDYFVHFQDNEKVRYNIGSWQNYKQSSFLGIVLALHESNEINKFYENPYDSVFRDRLHFLEKRLLVGDKLMIRIEISLEDRKYKIGSPTTYHDNTYVSYFESDLDLISSILKRVYKLRDAVSRIGYQVGVGFNKEKVIVDLVKKK